MPAWMVLAVGGHRVAGIAHLAHAFGIGLGLPSDQEEGRLGAMGGENVEDLVAVFRQRAVVEGQHHLVVFSGSVLSYCMVPMMDAARIDHNGAGRADGVGMAGQSAADAARVRRPNRAGPAHTRRSKTAAEAPQIR